MRKGSLSPVDWVDCDLISDSDSAMALTLGRREKKIFKRRFTSRFIVST
jgi:hypothetical protein